jgi:sulfur carrier protein
LIVQAMPAQNVRWRLLEEKVLLEKSLRKNRRHGRLRQSAGMARRSPKKVNLKVVVNGQIREISDRLTVAGLIEALGLNARTLVVQRNDDVVNREQFGEIILADGDSLELIRFVGGG